MTEELRNGCSPSDCASCSSSCGAGAADGHHTITLTMDDGREIEFAILTVFPVEDREYIALLPLDENGRNHDGEVYLYAFTRTESGDPMLENILNQKEYAKAAKAFETILSNAREAELAGDPLE